MPHPVTPARAPGPAAERAERADHAWITRLPTPLSLQRDGPLSGLRFAAKDNIDVVGSGGSS